MSAEPNEAARGSIPLRAAAEPSRFSATRTAMPGAVRLALTGELDLATVPVAEHALRQALGENPNVLLDLRGLTFIDASGLRVVLAADTHASDTGGRLAVLCDGARCVARLLELTRADRPLEIVDEPAAAPPNHNGAGPRPL